jgi:hypothetical protein
MKIASPRRWSGAQCKSTTSGEWGTDAADQQFVVSFEHGSLLRPGYPWQPDAVSYSVMQLLSAFIAVSASTRVL